MTYVPLQFRVEYLNSQNSGFWDSLYEDTPGDSIKAGDTGVAPPVVPTLNEWGIIVLMTLLAGAAAWKMNKPELL